MPDNPGPVTLKVEHKDGHGQVLERTTVTLHPGGRHAFAIGDGNRFVLEYPVPAEPAAAPKVKPRQDRTVKE